MERIIKLEEIILKEDEILAEVFYKEQLIIRADSAKTTDFDYCKVISTGSQVDDIKKDDILLQVNGGDGFKVSKRTFIVVRRYFIGVAVKPDNFLLNKNALN